MALLVVVVTPFGGVLSLPAFLLVALLLLAESWKKKSKVFFALLYACIAVACLALAGTPVEVFDVLGAIGDLFAISAIILAAQSQRGKLRRSSPYLLASIALGCYGVLHMALAHVTDVFSPNATILVFVVAFLMGLMSLTRILSTGEILRPSGIGKVILLLVIGFMTVSFVGRLLERARMESRKALAPETKVLRSENKPNRLSD
ncbi:MAG: hypothetical protein J7L51_03145 [Desulfurococcales archaeon]|nr:hypothetical protein [Desulfurococcales archaeon]